MEYIEHSQRQAHNLRVLMRAHPFTYLQIVGWFFCQPLVHQLQGLFVVASLDCIPYWSILPCYFVNESLRRGHSIGSWRMRQTRKDMEHTILDLIHYTKLRQIVVSR